MIDDALSAGVIAYVGVAGRSDGQSPAERVAEAMRAPAQLLPRIESLLADLDAAEPPLWQTPSIAEVGARTSAFLHARHPELSPEAVPAITAWFTYRWR